MEEVASHDGDWDEIFDKYLTVDMPEEEMDEETIAKSSYGVDPELFPPRKQPLVLAYEENGIEFEQTITTPLKHEFENEMDQEQPRE